LTGRTAVASRLPEAGSQGIAVQRLAKTGALVRVQTRQDHPAGTEREPIDFESIV
jgi:hypothetical protein